jgi:hypothetical protein
VRAGVVLGVRQLAEDPVALAAALRRTWTRCVTSASCTERRGGWARTGVGALLSRPAPTYHTRSTSGSEHSCHGSLRAQRERGGLALTPRDLATACARTFGLDDELSMGRSDLSAASKSRMTTSSVTCRPPRAIKLLRPAITACFDSFHSKDLDVHWINPICVGVRQHLWGSQGEAARGAPACRRP